MSDAGPNSADEPHSLQRYWRQLGGAGDVDALLHLLGKVPGIALGVDRAIRLGVALAALAARGARFEHAGDAADVMMPLLAINGEGQVAARDTISTFWADPAAAKPESSAAVGPSPLRQQATALRRRYFVGAASIVALLAVAILVVAFVPDAMNQVVVDPPDVPPPDPDNASASFWPWFAELLLTDILHRLFAVLVVLSVAMVWWDRTSRRRNERLARDNANGSIRGTMTPEVNEVLFPTAMVRRAGRLLRRPIRVLGHRIDVASSVEASIDAAGFPTLLTGLESRTPDCLMLVDRVSRNDHVSALADALAKRLRDGGADLLRYEFSTFPDVLEAVGRRFGGEPVISLATLAQRHSGARVVIVGTGRGFFEPHLSTRLRREKPFFGEPEELPFVDHRQLGRQERRLPRALPAFRDPPILLTPAPPDRWGPAERELQVAGFAVISMGLAEDAEGGLEHAVEAVVNGGRPNSVDRTVIANATPGYDPLLQELERAELASDIAPGDNEYRNRLARRVMSFACARIGEAAEGEPPDDPYEPDEFSLRAGAGVAALALFPRLDPTFTPQVWKAATGETPSAARLARLARLPWFRAGRMPDWFRSDLALCFREEAAQGDKEAMQAGKEARWPALRGNLAGFAAACLARTPNEQSRNVYQPPIGNLRSRLNDLLSQFRTLRHAADPVDRSLVEERLFLTFIEEGRIAADDLSVALPPAVNRATPAMRLGLAGFAVAAVVAAAFAPWVLREVYSWATAIVDSGISLGGLALLACEIFLAILIALSFDSLFSVHAGNRRFRLDFTIAILSIAYIPQYFIVESVSGSPSYRSYDYSIIVFYFSFSLIPISLICLTISSGVQRSINSHFVNFEMIAKRLAIFLSIISSFTAILLSELNNPEDSGSIISVLLLACLFFAMTTSILVGYILSAILWQVLIFWLFLAGSLDVLLSIRDTEITEMAAAFSAVGLYSLSITLASGAADAWSKVKFFVFLWISSAPALCVAFLDLDAFLASEAALVIGAVSCTAIAGVLVVGKLGSDRLRRLPSTLLGYLLKVLKAELFGRFGRGLGWVDLILKAALVGAIVALVANASVSALGWATRPAAVSIDTTAQDSAIAPVFPPTSNLLEQAARIFPILIAVFALCRIAFALYLPPTAASVSNSPRRWWESPWWAVPALWAVAVVPLSMQHWLSAAGLQPTIAAALDSLRADGFATVGSIDGAVTWLLQVQFGLGRPTWHWLGYLALPVALHFGLRAGAEADQPILAGLLPFVLAGSLYATSTPGGIWMLPIVFVSLRLARDPSARQRLLRFGGGFGGRRPNPFVVFAVVLGLALLLSPGIAGSSGTDGAALIIDPELARAVVFVLIGAMRLPRWPVLAAIGLCVAIAFLPNARLDLRLADTDVTLSAGFTLGQAIDLALAYAAVPIARRIVARRSHVGEIASIADAIVLWEAIAVATLLGLGGGYQIGLFTYEPTAATVAILALSLGMAAPSRDRRQYFLAMLGGVALAVPATAAAVQPLVGSSFWQGFGIVSARANLASPFADLVAAIPSMGITVGFMLLGGAVASALVGARPDTDHAPRPAVKSWKVPNRQKAFAT